MRALRLNRYFSLAALLLLVLAGVLLGFLVRRQAVAQMERLAIDRNVVMTQVLGNFLSQDIAQIIANAQGRPPAALQASTEVAALHDKLGRLIRGSDIAKVKLYSLQGLTVFSTERQQIGEDKAGNSGFVAARQGEVVSELVHRQQFSATDGDLSDVDLMSSYVPVRQGAEVVAVFELYQDVTRLLEQIRRSLWQVAGIVLAVFGALYLMLVAVVRRAQTALITQEALLEATNRDLDRRVEERTQALTQSQARLRESEARFRSLTEMSSDFYWESDAQHRFTVRTFSVREAQDKVFCSNPFVGQLRWEVSNTSPDEAGWQAHRAQLDAHQPFRDFEISRPGEAGQLLYVSVSGDPVFEEKKGQFLGYRGVGTDITARKQFETELRIAAAAFESQQSMLVTDANSVIQRVNKAFTESSGYAPQDVIGQTPRLLRSARHDSAFYAAMWKSIARTGFWQGELWSRRKNGEEFAQWLSISAVKNHQGQVTHYVGAYVDISERKRAQEHIHQLAFFDPLTGLPNRALLMDRLKLSVSLNVRSDVICAVLFIDLDNFKALNDTQGHASGDQLLQQAAKRLQERLREGDTVARVGGDEFVVLVCLTQTGPLSQGALAVEGLCQKLLDAMAQPYALPHGDFHCSASIGITLFQGQSASVDDLMRQADMAMYKSKSLGGNRFSFFDPEMESAALEHMRLQAQLRQALVGQQFELFLQPQVDGRSGAIVGAEALIRWRHPERGLVGPNDFIPHAERTGLILPIGHWVLQAACERLAAWQANPSLAELCLSVNVSAQQFGAPDFVESVARALDASGAPATRLKLELTESIFVGDIDEVVRVMHRLKTIGLGFSLDDFGTGYSSLAYLSRLPLDQLKIDRSFVSQIESGDNSVVICAATISLAHSLRLKVVAEGVENGAQRYFLSTVHRCDLLQGYLFGRPMPHQIFEQQVLDWQPS